MYYKKLVGEDIYLSPVDVNNEYQIITKWFNEDEGIAYNNGFYGSVFTEENAKELLEKWQVGAYDFSIIEKDTDEFIGHVNLFGMDRNLISGTMGIYLCEKARGKGYGKQAIKLLVEYIFSSQVIQNIHLEVFSYNEVAYKTYKAVGFRECGRYHKAKYHLGEYYDIILMEMSKRDYINIKRKAELQAM